MENFKSATTTDLIEAYNDLVQFCKNPFEITLKEIIVLQASTGDDDGRLLQGQNRDDEPTNNVDLNEQRTGQIRGQRDLRRRHRAFGFLQGFGSCGRTCPSNSRLFDDTNRRNLGEEQQQQSQLDVQSTRSLGVHHSRSAPRSSSSDSSPDFTPCGGDLPTEEEMMLFYSAFIANRNYNNIVDVVTIEELDEAPVTWSKCSKYGSSKSSGKKRGSSGSKSSKRHNAARGSARKRRSDDDDGRHHSLDS